MQKQLYGVSRESPGLQRSSNYSGNLKKTALNNSRFSLSVRSNQSIPGIKSDYNVVESFGSPLPVVVNEALTFKDGPCIISAKCSQNGWAWVVQGRRLLIWQYREPAIASQPASPPRRSLKINRRGGTLAQCRELTLPHSDIPHKTDLVSVFQTEGQQMASCIAVSATGDVRYWASIAHDGNSVDLASILDGQEFAHLLNLPAQHGYLAITTTCNLVFLRVGHNNGRHAIYHKAIKPATSFLGGLGKRVASIIIGSNSADKEQNFVNMCCETKSTEGESVVVVLSDRAVQRWRLSNKGNSEQLIYEDAEIVRKIREEFQQKFWNMRLPTDNADIALHLLDFHLFKEKAYILAGAVNASHTQQMCYGVVVAVAQPDCMQLESFTPLKLNKFFSTATVQDCLSLRFLVSTTHIYMYTAKVVYPMHLLNTAPTAELEAEKIEFHLHDDRILCAAICNHIPVFFSRTHGLVSITPGDFDSTELMNMSNCNTPDMFAPVSFNGSFAGFAEQSMAGPSNQNLHLFELDPDDVYNELSDEVGQLKAAFLYRLKRNNNMMNTIINDLMRSLTETDPNGAPVDAYKLDRIVITIAEDLAEDVPISDPRWEEAYQDHDAHRHALGSSHSLQIINQLRDKSFALHHFIEFLHTSGIWTKLNAIPCGASVLRPTCYILADISEKIVAAMALCIFQTKMQSLIDDAINLTVSQWDEKPQGKLTAHDIFYVKVCKFQCIFEALAEIAEERIAAQSQYTVSVAQFVCDINCIVLEILDQVLKHREQNASSFALSSGKLESYEYMPWTVMSGSAGVRDTLSRLIEITVRYGANCASEPELKHKLYQQILEMMDILLDGRKNHLESVRDTEKSNVLQQQFKAQRRELISVLIKEHQYEYAAKLAEKYLDFQSLVIICDETEDQERLDDYTRKYADYDFSQLAINWHLRQNRHGEVFERFKGNQAALAQLMSDHPSLGWVQLIFNGDFERAAKMLFELALNETEFVGRKKSMLSLAKLAAFAAADSDLTAQVEKINTELLIIDYQDNLGHDLLNNFGYDATEQPVLKVDDIINLFISEENESASETDFRKALELLNYVDQPYDMRHKIWCAAIRRDNWLDYDHSNAIDYIQKLLFFKIIELSQLMGEEWDTFLPPIEDFMDSAELDDLPQQKSFQYLMKLTYEYIADTFKGPEELMEL